MLTKRHSVPKRSTPLGVYPRVLAPGLAPKRLGREFIENNAGIVLPGSEAARVWAVDIFWTLSYNKAMKRWTESDVQFLIDNYPIYGAVMVADNLGRTRQSVNIKAMRLGIILPDALKLQIAQKKASENLVHKSGELNPNWKGGKKPNIYYKKRSVEKYKDRELCRSKTRSKIRSGEIKKMPCVVCGDQKSESHHEDYSKPYEIIWLCRKHHIDADKKRRERESS